MTKSDPQPDAAFEWTDEPWGRALRCRHLAAAHLFTSRDLVLRDDEREWTHVATSLGVDRQHLLLVRQVHGVQVVVARRAESRRAGERPTGDIVIADDPSVAIGVRVADCAPVLIHDPSTGVVGAAHAGWRGAAANAAGAAVRAMQQTFGSHPADLVAAIGPCLGACCGEVGPEVVDAFRVGGAVTAQIDAWFTPGRGDRSFLDLERANRDQLVRAGLNPAAIFASGLCTKTHHDRLHSYRSNREQAGRMLGAIRATESHG